MKKSKMLAVVVFMLAISVISFDSFAAVQTKVLNVDLKTFGLVSNYDAAKEYNSYQKWIGCGAKNSQGKTQGVYVNIKGNSNETGWDLFPYDGGITLPDAHIYTNKKLKEPNAYRAQLKTENKAITTYHSSNLWYLSY